MWVKPGKGLEFGNGVQYQQDVTSVINSYHCTSIAAMNNLFLAFIVTVYKRYLIIVQNYLIFTFG